MPNPLIFSLTIYMLFCFIQKRISVEKIAIFPTDPISYCDKLERIVALWMTKIHLG